MDRLIRQAQFGRRRFVAGVIALGAMPVMARAASRPVRIGVLNFGSAPAAGAAPEPIVRHLAALGYVAGRNVSFERRYADGSRSRFPALAAELAASGVDLIFSPGSDIARTFVEMRSRIPVVFVVSDDPVATGLAASLQRPGGVFTGISLMSPELGGKRLEYLKQALPKVRRIAVLHDRNHAFYVEPMREPAARMGIELAPLQFEESEDFSPAFERARAAKAEAMFVAPNRYTLAYAARIAGLSLQHRLPSISAYDSFALAGGLLSYGPVQDDAVARAAAIIDKIIKGARPGEIPIEQPPRIVLIVNARTAKAFDLVISPELLLRADQVIE